MKSPREIQIEIYGKMTGAEKIEEAFKLREMAWIMKAAGVRMQHPDWNEDAVQQEVRKIFLHAST
ncbi:MAG: hypothetical protein AB7F86_12050 [Bdellovibrionales bacterium]